MIIITIIIIIALINSNDIGPLPGARRRLVKGKALTRHMVELSNPNDSHVAPCAYGRPKTAAREDHGTETFVCLLELSRLSLKSLCVREYTTTTFGFRVYRV